MKARRNFINGFFPVVRKMSVLIQRVEIRRAFQGKKWLTSISEIVYSNLFINTGNRRKMSPNEFCL